MSILQNNTHVEAPPGDYPQRNIKRFRNGDDSFEQWMLERANSISEWTRTSAYNLDYLSPKSAPSTGNSSSTQQADNVKQAAGKTGAKRYFEYSGEILFSDMFPRELASTKSAAAAAGRKRAAVAGGARQGRERQNSIAEDLDALERKEKEAGDAEGGDEAGGDGKQPPRRRVGGGDGDEDIEGGGVDGEEEDADDEEDEEDFNDYAEDHYKDDDGDDEDGGGGEGGDY